jgi:hypothetical protein
MRKLTKIVMVASVTMVCAYLGLSYYVQKTFKLRISVPAITEKGRVIGDEAKKLGDEVRHGHVPRRPLDHKSVGFPRQEARLLQLQNSITLFSASYGHLPTDVGQLSSLSVPPADKRSFDSLIKDCQILGLEPDSYILNCDGWTPPPASQITELVQTFDGEIERFYVREGHVLLFVPPSTSRRVAGP